ncbi:hypothetical protein MMC11_005998 [Xylographa trunciseda]|nr:hypothetical protein [Xylographa trunciseda]
MSQTETAPRISITANRAVTGTLFGVAIISYAIRTYIRAIFLKQFSTEDALLLFAVICLVGTTALAYSTMQAQYDSVAVILNGAEGGLIFSLLDELPEIAKKADAAATLWWFVIVPVKLAYLFFFRRLISRLRDLNIWWWCVIAFTIPAGLACVAAGWLTCPYFTAIGVLSCSGPAANDRVVRDTTITTVLDIVTDVLVVTFPIALLWRVRITARQKVGLAVLLCLSLVMVITAITRISGIKLPGGAIDIVWLAFWQQQECSIAVIMVSVSAFRSFFVVSASNNASPRKPKSSTYWRRRLVQKRSASSEDSEKEDNVLPQIPSATMTGMRTVIRETRGSGVRPNGPEPGSPLLPHQDWRLQATQRPYERAKVTPEHYPRDMPSSKDYRLVRENGMV